MQCVRIKNCTIGLGYPPYIIAEMSGNHNQSLERALKIVEVAANVGVDAVKLQTYTADTMTIDLASKEFFIDNPQSLWCGKSLYELYQETHTPWEWHKPIFDLCKQLGLVCFSTPFDETAVDFLETLDVPAYKIASFENNHLPLIKKIAKIGKPILISTGMASVAELDDAIKTARQAGCNDLILLKCTSTYPASPKNTNLLTIPHMQDLFDCQVGLSDHTLGIGVAIASAALGANVIEKHFTLSRADGGADATFSIEPDEMKSLVIETKNAWQALGKIKYGLSNKEKESIMFRRSIYITEDMLAGDTFTPENIRLIRPGNGISPKYYDTVLGKVINKSAKKGTALSWDFIG